MKSAEAKIDEIFSSWVRDSQTLEQLERRIVQAIKDQDRDTRHACAEAVLSLHWEIERGQAGVKAYACLIDRDEAYAACLNVKAI